MIIEYIKDIANSNFLGINIYTEMVYLYLEKMKNILGEDYDEYVKYQQDRDRGHYHCTVLNVADLNKVTKDLSKVEIINNIIGTKVNDFKLIGLGSVERQGNKAYFLVVRSEQMQDIRRSLKLDEIDFHITLGFKYKDVHGLRKNVVLTDVDPFIGALKQYYFDFDQSFNFCKELDLYTFDVDKDIYCTKIADTYANFKVGNQHGTVDMFTVSLISNKLRISCIWQGSNDEKPYLADTLILRKLGKR
jgi:hypothetical protein